MDLLLNILRSHWLNIYSELFSQSMPGEDPDLDRFRFSKLRLVVLALDLIFSTLDLDLEST